LVLYDTRDYGELYDLESDPHQTENLYDSPSHRAVREAMMARYRPKDPAPDVLRPRMAVA
jgi:hypothetical protein